MWLSSIVVSEVLPLVMFPRPSHYLNKRRPPGFQHASKNRRIYLRMRSQYQRCCGYGGIAKGGKKAQRRGAGPNVRIFMFAGWKSVFEGITIAGAFIGMQMGMAIMNVFDPSSQQQQPIISNFWLLVMVIFFLVTNSHYFLIATIFENFNMIKLGTAEFHPVIGREFIRGGSIMYDLALKFAAPTMVFLLVVDVAIAFMARVMPQLNVFFVSLPLKIGIGIFLLIISLKIFQSLFSYVIIEMETFVTSIIKGI